MYCSLYSSILVYKLYARSTESPANVYVRHWAMFQTTLAQSKPNISLASNANWACFVVSKLCFEAGAGRTCTFSLITGVQEIHTMHALLKKKTMRAGMQVHPSTLKGKKTCKLQKMYEQATERTWGMHLHCSVKCSIQGNASAKS